MTEPEVRMILARAAALDNRQVTDAMVIIWHEAFQGYTYDEVLWAFNQHVRTSTEYLIPARLIQAINHKRHEHRMINPTERIESADWVEFERQEIAAAQVAKAIRAGGKRYAVEVMDGYEMKELEGE